jgi:dCMP deaminase
MKEKFAIAHMRAAYVYADLSHCVRKKVGCVIVKNDSIISIGYNGTPAGEDNCCEISPDESKPSVIHAEDNALRKLTRRTESAEGATMFVTACPCPMCAPRIRDAGIAHVYYVETYRSVDGKKYLEEHGIEVTQLPGSYFVR